MVQHTAILTMADLQKVLLWSIERRHFQWPWTIPTSSIKVTPIVDAECLRNGTTYRHSFNEILIGTCTRPTQHCHFQLPWVILSDLAKYSMTQCVERYLCDSWAFLCWKCVCLIQQHKRCEKVSPWRRLIGTLQASIGHSGHLSSSASDVFSTHVLRHRNAGNYRGLSVFVKFLELERVMLTREDLLELKHVRLASNTAVLWMHWCYCMRLHVDDNCEFYLAPRRQLERHCFYRLRL